MQNATVDIAVEVSHLTADALEELGKNIDKTTDQIGTFLLIKGFSNLYGRRSSHRKGLIFPKKVLATRRAAN